MINKNLVNFNEHGYNVKLEDHFFSNYPMMFYGYLHEMSLSFFKNYRIHPVLNNFRCSVSYKDGITDNTTTFRGLVCGQSCYKQILTIGNVSLDLRYYTHEQVIKFIEEKLGI